MFFKRSSKFCKIKTAATESITFSLFFRDKSADKRDLSAATVVSLSSQNVMGSFFAFHKLKDIGAEELFYCLSETDLEVALS